MKALFLIAALVAIAVMYTVNEPQQPIVYSPALLHTVECNNQQYEIMIPPGIDAEIYSKQYCLTLTSR